MSLSGAGTMSLSIALPAIMADLNVPEAQLQWISSAFALTNGCFLLLAGRLADVYGRKMVFVVGISWNALWNLVGGWMNNTAGLVVTRALAGVGSAACIPAGIGIIAATFSGRTRSSAFAAFSAGGPIGGGLGLIVGGLLTAYTSASWRAALWCFGGVAFAVAVAGYLVVVPDRHLDTDRRVDWIGAAIITIGLVLLQFSISDAESASNGWKTGYIIALLVLSVLMIAAFFVWEHYVETRTTRPPLMRLGLWTRARGKLAATYLVGGICWMGFTSMFFNATLFYQQVQMTGTIGAMLRFIPCCVSGLLCNVLVAKVIHLVPGQTLICIGIAATGLANVFFAIAPRDAIYWGLPFNAMWMVVLGADFLMAVGSVFVSTLALPEEQSVAGAVFQTLVQLGGALGLAFVGVVQTTIARKEQRTGVDHVTALLHGLRGGFWFGAGAAFTAGIIALVVLRGMGTYGGKTKEGSETETEKSISVEEVVEKRGEERV
ncbi:MFS general substrate transporter [Cutaneotrichosporon oleaginosum]|uniref:MFS general substrate transporter n=2 Tax=Cutaneotrichosporon oleaginosum TaxID=879819 RepID=A0A0J1ASR0_9TREE|nr:MFS general substrate transporter [Cutaneotrichosporon oleaginosum]KLT38369.1 MFS general substrate transporter [Cutaneotrichosporon oleaginosum]